MEQGTAQLATLVAARREKIATDQERLDQEMAANRAAKSAEWRIQLAATWEEWGLTEMFGPAAVEPEGIAVGSIANMVKGVPVQGVLSVRDTWTLGDSEWVRCAVHTPLASSTSDGGFSGHVILGKRETIERQRVHLALLDSVEYVLREHKKILQRKQERARLRETARAFEALWAEFHAASQAWAAKWQQALWAVVPLWQVRYVPLEYAVDDGPRDGAWESAVVLDDPETIGAALRQRHFAAVTEVTLAGSLIPVLIPNVLDMQPVMPGTPTITNELPYYRHYTCGRCKLNVPVVSDKGSVEAALAERPESPESFTDYLRREAPELMARWQQVDADAAEIAAWTDDEL